MVITTFFSLCTLELVHISTSSALHPLVFPLTCTYIYSTFIHIDILTVTMYPEVMEWLNPILQGKVPGGRKTWWKKLRWEDNFKAWTGLTLTETHVLTKDREAWQKLVRVINTSIYEQQRKEKKQNKNCIEDKIVRSLVRLYIVITTKIGQDFSDIQ